MRTISMPQPFKAVKRKLVCGKRKVFPAGMAKNKAKATLLGALLGQTWPADGCVSFRGQFEGTALVAATSVLLAELARP